MLVVALEADFAGWRLGEGREGQEREQGDRAHGDPQCKKPPEGGYGYANFGGTIPVLSDFGLSYGAIRFPRMALFANAARYPYATELRLVQALFSLCVLLVSRPDF